jgi:hypothetical protein
MNINRFNQFGIPGGTPEILFKHQPINNDEKNTILTYAIQEIEICTPDSLELAVDTLKLEQVESTVLNELVKLYQTTGKQDRNETFHQRVLELKKKAIEEIKNLFEK